MRKIQKLCAAMMLLILLSVSTPGGEITTGVVSPTPPPSVVTTITEPSHISTDATTESTENESASLLTEIAFSLLQLLVLI